MKVQLTCHECKKNFYRLECQIKHNIHNFCSRKCLGKYNVKNLTGKPKRRKNKLQPNQTISYLTLLETLKIKGRQHWSCECVCGKILTRREDYLHKCIRNQYMCSCGCQRTSKRTGQNSSTWQGYGKISGYYFTTIKNRAIKKGLSCTITIQQIWDLFLKQNQKCALSGIDIQIAESRRTKEIMTASLDRIDSSKGYTIDNVQWVHKDINTMKNNIPQNQFIHWCQLVSQHNT